MLIVSHTLWILWNAHTLLVVVNTWTTGTKHTIFSGCLALKKLHFLFYAIYFVLIFSPFSLIYFFKSCVILSLSLYSQRDEIETGGDTKRYFDEFGYGAKNASHTKYVVWYAPRGSHSSSVKPFLSSSFRHHFPWSIARNLSAPLLYSVQLLCIPAINIRLTA